MAGEPDLTVCVDGRKVIRRASDGPLLIGRDPLIADVTLARAGISRLHLWLHPGPTWTLVDYDSRNGVYLAGRRVIGDVMITDGLTVHLADPAGVAMTFHYAPACHCVAGPRRRTPPDVSRTA